MKATNKAVVNKLNEALKHEKEFKTVSEQAYKEARYLFQIIEKYKFFKNRKLKKVEEPVVFLFRQWGDVEIYEGVRGDTFTVPKPKKDKRKIVDKSYKQIIEGNKVIYLEPSALRNIWFGGHKVKAYFIDSEDAMPLKSDKKVWSEMMEMTISAVLINYRNLLTKMQRAEWEGLKGIIKWGVIGVLGYIMVKAMWPEAPEPVAQLPQQIAQNVSGITEVVIS